MIAKCPRREAPPGKFGMYILCLKHLQVSTFASFDKAGENKAAWRKDTNSAAVAEPTVVLASAIGALGNSMCHS
jgi:hypothetical protein